MADAEDASPVEPVESLELIELVELLDTHPNAPRNGPVWLAFALVVLSGVLGGLIGYSLVSATCSETSPLLRRLLSDAGTGVDAPSRSCAVQQIGGSLAGSLIAALGTAIVAVLVLRAMAEWRKAPPRPAQNAASREGRSR
jgi:ABC-type Fe3+ transport system permease subunit